MYEIQEVEVPACNEHQGTFATKVRIRWACPACGRLRGRVFRGLSWDGSRRLPVDCWVNPCGHIDKYDKVRAEAAALQLELAAAGNGVTQ
jgi:hypothetical protein